MQKLKYEIGTESARLIINTHNISAFVLPLAGQKSRFKKIGANAHPDSLPPTDTHVATMQYLDILYNQGLYFALKILT